ncbi:MAG: N-acetyltransferase [Acidimicrobiales bacterium]|nr:N-acetyltransferase [Acidimicrobiales bacterium]
MHAGVRLGAHSVVGSHVVLGEPVPGAPDAELLIGERATIRSGTVVYAGSAFGIDLQVGHHATLRAGCAAGDAVRVGTNASLEGELTIGDHVCVHTNAHLSSGTTLGSFVWVFPFVVFTNDPVPPGNVLTGATVGDYAVIATGTVILPGVRIERHAVVGARSVVRQDIPEGMFATGDPARVVAPARYLRDRDSGAALYPWPHRFERGMPWAGVGFDAWCGNGAHAASVPA